MRKTLIRSCVRNHAIVAIAFCTILFAAHFQSARADDLLTQAREAPVTVGLSYEQWIAACKKLPGNRQLRGRVPSKDILPLKTFAEFDVVLTTFLEQFRIGALSEAKHWVGAFPDKDGFFNTSRGYFERATAAPSFRPFAQKLTVPEESEIFFHGDFHGDVQSFITALEWLNEQQYLKGFRIVRDDFYMVFLGDYTDRGMFGTEVLYTLMQLKLANPDRVFMARGNHEDISLIARYGFFQEGRAKFGTAFNVAKIARAYDFFPVVIYLAGGTNAIQCNHGGMEPGYDPRKLLAASGPLRFQILGRLNQKDFLDHHPHWPAGESAGRNLAMRAFQNFEPEDPVTPTVLGFMWNDFSVQTNEPQFALDPGRAFIFGNLATSTILQSASSTDSAVQAVFRAHQHAGTLNHMMRRLIASSGIFRHWQGVDTAALRNHSAQQLKSVLENDNSRPIPFGSVWTFNVSPDSVYGEGCNFSFDTFGILTTAKSFGDWRIRVINTQPVR